MKQNRRLSWAAMVLALLPARLDAQSGTIQFLPPVSYDLVTPEPIQLVAADFDNNGHLDVAVSCAGGFSEFDGAAISLLLGNGSGGFFDNPAIGEIVHLGSLAAADFDRDGNQDIAYVRLLQPTSQIVVAFGDGTASFPTSTTIDTPAGWLATADFNLDGIPDLVAEHQLSVFLGVGDGTFAPPLQHPHSLQVTDLVVADMNRDQIPDVVLTTHQGWVRVYLGDGTGGLTPAGAAGGGASFVQWNHVAVGDLNGDAIPDVAWVMDFPYEVKVAFGAGDGSLVNPQVIDSYGISPYDVTVSDFDQDGFNELAVTLRWSSVKVYQARGDGTFEPPLLLTTGLEPEICNALDLDEDGRPDLVIPTRNGGDTPLVAVHLNRSTVPAAVVLDAPAASLEVGGALPNPFRAKTSLRLTLPAASVVRAVVFDVAGRQVRGLFDGQLPAGTHLLRWDRRNELGHRVPVGQYFIRVMLDGRAHTQRLVVLD